MRILLMRHGQTPANVEGLLDTAVPGPGLTDLGRRQAEAVVPALAGEPVHGVFVSDLTRTHLTAAPLAEERGLKPRELGGLREVQAGSLEGSAASEDQRTYLGTAFGWSRGELGLRMPGAESGEEFFARYDAAVAAACADLARAQGPEATGLLVSHGAAIRAWTAGRVHGLSVEEVERTRLLNTGYVMIEGVADEQGRVEQWELLSFHHLPAGGAELSGDVLEDPTGAGTVRVEAGSGGADPARR